MSRRARLLAPGTLQHVCSRILERDGWLLSDAERTRYLEMLGRALEHSDWRCLAYCLTSSELHFAMVAGEQPLDSWSKRVNVGFAQFLNKRHCWSGPFFASRPISREVVAEHALDLIAAIHNHPVRAHLAPRAKESTWSSHRAYVGLSSSASWLDIEGGLLRAGFARRPDAFDEAVARLARESNAVPYVPSNDESGRHAVSSAHILEVVASQLGMSMATLLRRHVRGPAAEAKSIAAHAARGLGVPLADLASALGVTRQRTSQLAALDLAPRQREVVARVIERLDVQISPPSPR